jgi:hypothetical protein
MGSEKLKRPSKKLYGIYRGNEILQINGVQVLPAEEFLIRLSEGKII